MAGDASGRDILYIYEVRNTFGDMHAYIGAPTPTHATLEAEKILHVLSLIHISEPTDRTRSRMPSSA